MFESNEELSPLNGLRVLEISTYVAGPSCGVVLGQLGADVIRIDPIGGAPDKRRLPLDSDGESLYWEGLNQRKRSIEIETKSEEGRELVYALLAKSGADGGILVTNSVGRGWLSFDKLITHRRDLIDIQIEGRSDGGPAVDYTINCEVGIPLLTGPADCGGPVNHVLPAWDLLTGLHAAVGILSAERHRTRTGEGRLISISLADVAIATMGQLGYLSDVALNGRGRIRDGNYLYGSFGRNFRTKDGRHVMIVALTERQWDNLVKVTGAAVEIGALEELMGADLGLESDRYRCRKLVAEVFEPWFSQRQFREVSQALDENQVLWGTYRTVEELVYDPDSILNVSPNTDVVQRGEIGSYPSPRGVLRHRNWAGVPSNSAHAMGSDTRIVLQEILALDDGEIDRLQAEGVIGGVRI